MTNGITMTMNRDGVRKSLEFLEVHAWFDMGIVALHGRSASQSIGAIIRD